jgi:hypothetical protein
MSLSTVAKRIGDSLARPWNPEALQMAGGLVLGSTLMGINTWKSRNEELDVLAIGIGGILGYVGGAVFPLMGIGVSACYAAHTWHRRHVALRAPFTPPKGPSATAQ